MVREATASGKSGAPNAVASLAPAKPGQLGCTPPDTTVADAWDCILLTANAEADRVLSSEVTETGARVSLSGTAEGGTVTMVPVINAAGGNVRGSGRARAGAETKEIEKGKSEGEETKRG